MRHTAALGLVLALALIQPACQQSTVGPNGESSQGPQGPKVCIDDLRSVRLIHPTELELANLRTNDAVLVEWEVRDVCTQYMATVDFQIGSGTPYRIQSKNATSVLWHVPTIPVNACGNSSSLTISVSLRDSYGDIGPDMRGYRSTLQCEPRPVPPRHGQERD
jgi:hypothetical protein